MRDSSVIDQWNIIEAADMAVSVASVLDRLVHNKRLPFDTNEALAQGIAFLEEAQNGGAVICGSQIADGFTGTLSPLRWSTDVYIRFTSEGAAGQDTKWYDGVLKTLRQYQDVLTKLKQNKEVEDREVAERARDFFEALGDLLLSQADPSTRTYSQPVS